MTRSMPEKPFAPFDFDLGQAVTSQLVTAFGALSIGELNRSVLASVSPLPGVYQLFLDDTLMYVGKAEKSVAERLEEHRWNLSGRKNISGDALGFKALYIHKNWAPSAHEDVLIRHFRAEGSCEWNLTGLGNHDPGRNREDTITEDSHFDGMYPINEHFRPEGFPADSYPALQLLLKLKQSLPYIFRYESDSYRTGSPKYNHISVTLPSGDMTACEILAVVVQAFPQGWQATFLPGRAILYEEDRNYAHAIKIIRR